MQELAAGNPLYQVIRLSLFVSLVSVLPIAQPLAAPGKPIISGGTVRTADGDLLRGGSLHISKSYSARANEWGASPANLRYWRDSLHLNCIRLCCLDPRAIMDNRPDRAFATVEEEFPLADAVIHNAESLGIYVVLNYHCPLPNDHCNCPWDVRIFWEKYSKRYKDKPWIIFEMFNEGTGGWSPWGAENLWSSVYKIVRANAPDQIVIHGSPAYVQSGGSPDWDVWLTDTYLPVAGFRWDSGKDAFGYHSYWGLTISLVHKIRNKGIPIFMTEFTYIENYSGCSCIEIEGTHYPAQWCEQNNISWMDWVLWNQADQGQPRRDFLVPDAISKGWAWWNPSVAAKNPVAAVSRMTPHKGRRGLTILPNGRMSARGTVPGGGVNLSVLPEDFRTNTKIMVGEEDR